MARRLVETGVRFVEVISGGGVGWDTHRDNFPRTRALSLEADAGMAALIEDLRERGRLDSTLVVWMGEFGRSPQITSGGGRNHWARAWSSVLAGGGIRGGQVVGRTDRDGAEVVERPISVVDFLATVCKILGIDYARENHPPGIKRPIPIVDTSKPVSIISELF
jgi:arylsulfatase A-like enzyme